MKNFWKKLIAGVSAVALTVGAAQAVYIVSFDRINPQGSVPVATICGAQPDAGSTDLFGTITNVGTTTCTLTFGTAFVLAPTCLVQDITLARATMTVVVTNTSITIANNTAADKLAWMCVGKTGG